MKKIALFSLMCCLGMISNGLAGAWKDIKVYDNNWYRKHVWSPDEIWAFTNDYMLECDDDEGDVGDHVFGIKSVSDGFIAKECAVASSGDKWKGREIPWCESSNDKKCKHEATYTNNLRLCIKEEWKQPKSGVQFFLVNGKKNTNGVEKTIREHVACKGCKDGYVRPDTTYTFNNGCNGLCSFTPDMCVPQEMIDCYKAAKRKETAIWNNYICSCASRDNIDYSWISKDKKCVPNNSSNGGDKKVTPNNPNKPGFCEERKQWPKRYACCLAGNDTKWVGEDKSDNGTCECVDTNKEWKYDENTKRGQCVTKVQPVVGNECEYTFSGTINCGNGKNFTLTESKSIKVKCIEGVEDKIDLDKIEELFKEDTESLQKIKGEFCKEQNSVTTSTGPSEGEIESAKSTLAAFTGRAGKEASVWKDAEGNFNKARLASDLTAGVVLGTVGGVVSGVVIKKKQVEKGFEALHCTVGGQKIAGWGDEFSVGLNK